MHQTMIKAFLATAFLAGTASLLSAQSSNTVWLVTWNGQPTPGADVSVRRLATNGSGTALATGAASNFVSQVNLPALNSPYDLAVDTVMGKVYVLDNNVQGEAPEYIYSFNLAGTPAQIAASAQIIYTLPVPSADVSAGIYPLISGLALDAANHQLYFNQIDVTTGSNSYVGRLDLTASSKSNVGSANNGNPTLQTLYVGQVPSQGPIAIDAANLYISAINAPGYNDGIYAAPISGTGAFSEIITNSANDPNFANGFISGVASDPADNLIYYLTVNAGVLNYNYNLAQNAVWTYNPVTHVRTKIGSGYPGAPNNLAVDAANHRYYFTLGRDATGNASPTNYQAIYTGALGSTSAPTLFYQPALAGQDVAGQPNAGNVSLQGIYIQTPPLTNPPPVAVDDFISAQKNLTISIPFASLLTNDIDTNSGAILNIIGVNSTNNGTVGIKNNFVVFTPATNFTGLAQFTYTLFDGVSSPGFGKVTVNVLSLSLPSTNRLTVALAPKDNFLIFAGASAQGYVVQYATVLGGPWHDLSPVLPADVSGFIEYNDLVSPPSAMKFYRVRTGP